MSRKNVQWLSGPCNGKIQYGTIMILLAIIRFCGVLNAVLLSALALVLTLAPLFAAPLKIGDEFGGGVIVFIPKSSSGVAVPHGLIAADEDLPGLFNWKDGRSACENLELNGYNDWQLPDKDELQKLFVSKRVIGGFAESNYWNATESDKLKAWAQDFSKGSQSLFNKGDSLRVRPVRKF